MTDKTDALVALDIAIAQTTGSRVTLHLTRAKQLREALAAPAEKPDNPSDVDGGIDGEWYCESHPEYLMGHEGCHGAGIPACVRIMLLMNTIRLLRQEVRERDFQYGHLAQSAFDAAEGAQGEAVAEVVDALGTGILIPQWTGDEALHALPAGTKLYNSPPAASVELVEAVRELRRCQRDYLSQPKGERIEAKGRLVGLAADRVDAALALIDSAGGAKCNHCGKPKRAECALDACACASLTYHPQPAEGDGAVACGKCGVRQPLQHSPDCGRPAATAAVPEGFVLVQVYDLRMLMRSLPPTTDDVGLMLSFRRIASLLAAAPAAPKGWVVDEALHRRIADAERNTRTSTYERTRYWLDQWRQIARALATGEK